MHLLRRQSGDDFQEIDIDGEGNKRSTIRLSQRQIPPIHFSDALPERGIYWFSPTSMLLSYLVGLAAAVGQHIFYTTLVGDYVGTIDDQQRVLRWGTTLAFIHQIALVSSVSIAYTQILWRSLRRANLSVRGLDAAFGANTSLLSFLNWEMIANVKVPTLVALVAWTLPIASLVAPATLSIGLTMHNRAVMANVLSLNISDPNQSHRYAYAVPSNSSRPEEKTFLRPRTVLTRLAVASSTNGVILPITPPFTNATYEVDFFGPMVKCKDASSEVSKQIQAAMERTRFVEDESLMQIQNSYFAFVPDLSQPGLDANGGVVQVSNHSDNSGALHGSNELWLGFQRYHENPDGTAMLRPHQLQCQLYNTSYQISFSFVQGAQSLNWKELKPLNLIPYPVGPSKTDEDQMEMAYTAFMWTLSDQLTGSIGFYSNITKNPSSGSNTFSQILTSLQETALLGSSDLQSFFDYNRVLYPSKKGTGTEKVSDQRAADIAFARNRTFDVLIEELSANVTLSLMNSDLLSPSVTANVTTTEPINVYLYDPKNLYLSYGIALLLALLANILGALAYISNGVSHDNSFSSIVRATRNPDIMDCEQRRRVPGALPLDRQLGQKVLRLRHDGFVVWQDEKQ